MHLIFPISWSNDWGQPYPIERKEYTLKRGAGLCGAVFGARRKCGGGGREGVVGGFGNGGLG